MTTRRSKYADVAEDEAARPPERLEGEVELFNADATQRQPGTRGPAPDPNSLSARVKRGDAAHLHAIVDRALHKRLKQRSLDTERSVSELVEDALVQYLGGK